MPTHNRISQARKHTIAHRLPDPTQILRASLIERYTQCCKPGCKCMRGQKHGPSYTASVTLGPGKTRQIYVRREDLSMVKRMIDNYGKMWRGLMEISDINFEMLRPTHRQLRGKAKTHRSQRRE